MTNTYNQLSQYEEAYQTLYKAYNKKLLQQDETIQLVSLSYNTGRYEEADSMIIELEKSGLKSDNLISHLKGIKLN